MKQGTKPVKVKKSLRPLRASDEEFFGIQENIRTKKEELKKVGVRASWGGTGLALLRAFVMGKIPVSKLKGMGGEEDVVGPKNWDRG